MAVKILLVALANDMDVLGELSSILGDGYEVTFIRGADRQKMEMALDGHIQYDGVHLMAHGCESQLSASDGMVSEAEIVSLLESQTALRFVLVASCDSYEIIGGVHNALHVPVVGYNSPIDDKAAVEFSRAFYRAWRRINTRHESGIDTIDYAVARGRESLAVTYPNEARKIRLINSDITPKVISASLNRVDTQLTVVMEKLEISNAEIAQHVSDANNRQIKWLMITSVLLLLLIVAQLMTPWLQIWLRSQP